MKLINKKWNGIIKSKKDFTALKEANENLSSFYKKNKIIIKVKIEDINSKKIKIYKGGEKKYLKKVDVFLKRNNKVITTYANKKYREIVKNAERQYGRKMNEYEKSQVSGVRGTMLQEVTETIRDIVLMTVNKNKKGVTKYNLLKQLSKKLSINLIIKKNEFKNSDITEKEIYYLDTKIPKGKFVRGNVRDIISYDDENKIQGVKEEYTESIIVYHNDNSYTYNYYNSDIILKNEENSLNYETGQKIKVKVNYFDYIKGDDLEEKHIVK